MSGLKLLLWKSWKVQSRNKGHLIFELVVPTLYVFFFVLTRCLIDQETFPSPTEYKPFSVSRMEVPLVLRHSCREIYFYPALPITEQITRQMNDQIFKRDGLNYTFTGFSRKEVMIQSYKDSVVGFSGRGNQSTSPVLAIIVFENIKYKTLPTSIRYTLSFPSYQRTMYDPFIDRTNFEPTWFSERDYPPYLFVGPRSKLSPYGGFPGYYEEGFLYVQWAVESTISKMLLENSSRREEYERVEVELGRFPYPGYTSDVFNMFLQWTMSFVICGCAVYPVMSITKQIIHEKAIGIKEFTKIMGLSSRLHWLSWFIQSFVMLSISGAIIVLVYKIGFCKGVAMFNNSDPLVLYTIVCSYYFSMIGFCFFASTLFNVAETGATAAGFMWLILFLPFMRFVTDLGQRGRREKLTWTFMLPNVGISFLYFCLGSQESLGRGASWSNFWEGPSNIDPYSIGDACVMFLIDGLVYMLLAFYLELVFPGKYGVPLPWYFPFTKWYWTNGTRESESESGRNSVSIVTRLKSRSSGFRPVVEKEPTNLKAGIEISGLSKVFGAKVAVSELNLKMYENQVTSLLGHNGAGKTTTMSILTGLVRPSSGTAVINSLNIRTDMVNIRSSLGLCPQGNVLFDDLTVQEHLRFYCILKGMDGAEVIEEIDRMLAVLDLVDKRHAPARTLSGGMKRKLSVGIAFSAGSKVVLLDEPSAGMDVEARRSTWDLIQSEKIGRTVILTTHYMEEADLLGDRIAIMAEGHLECCGSSLFLKSKYGGDYNLVMVKEVNCNVDEIRCTIVDLIPSAILHKDLGTELQYILPAKSIGKFPELFDKLEERRDELGIESYGVESTTMEEIFLRVGKEAKERKVRKCQSLSKRAIESQIKETDTGRGQIQGTALKQKEQRNSGLRLNLQQMKAMLKKKLIVSTRSWKFVLLQVCLPISITLMFTGLALCTQRGLKIYRITYQLNEMAIMKNASVLFNCPSDSKMCNTVKSLCREGGLDLEQLAEGESLSSTLLEKAENDIINFSAKYMLAFEEQVISEQQQDTAINTPNETSLSLLPYLNISSNSVQMRSKLKITGLFNNQPLHTPPAALSLLTNSLLEYFGSKHRISVSAFPLEATALDRIRVPPISFNKWFIVGWSMTFGMAFLSSSFVIFPVRERQSKSRHLQFIAGVNCAIFWFTNWLVDFVIFFACTLATLILLMVCYVEELEEILVEATVLCVAYAWATSFFIMYLSTVCSNAASTYSRLVALKGCGGVCTMTILCFFQNPLFKLDQYVDVVSNIFMIFPNFAMGVGFVYIGLHGTLHEYCGKINFKALCSFSPNSLCCSKLQKSRYAMHALGIGQNIACMFIFGLFFLLLLIAQETGLLKKVNKKLRKFIINRKNMATTGNGGIGNGAASNGRSSMAMEVIDTDVAAEKERITKTDMAILCQTDNLVFRNLRKKYKNGMVAVDGLNLGVRQGEIFGLLGKNGAGKTTAFKMLTGDVSITSGDAYINSFSVKKSLKKAHSKIGYCPQFDACLGEMTGRETLTMFAHLKGLPEPTIAPTISAVAQSLLFAQLLDKQIKRYSGGNKRKLSTALAMIGQPSIIFLDEPTAGMDPEARRHVWNTLSKVVRESATSILITSHLMEECEALCSKLAIMVKGQLRCLGSPQHLKSKLCQGFSLVAQLPFVAEQETADPESPLTLEENRRSTDSEWETSMNNFHAFLASKFPGCELKDAHPGFVEYHLPGESTHWSTIFAVMEEAKQVHNLEAYSVGQVNLENVFFDCINKNY